MATNSNFIISRYDGITGKTIIAEPSSTELIEIEQMLDEQRQWDIDNAARQAELKIKREAAEAKLEALGLTTDDLAALGL